MELKSAIKMKGSRIRNWARRTGGVSPTDLYLTEVEEAILSIIEVAVSGDPNVLETKN